MGRSLSYATFIFYFSQSQFIHISVSEYVPMSLYVNKHQQHEWNVINDHLEYGNNHDSMPINYSHLQQISFFIATLIYLMNEECRLLFSRFCTPLTHSFILYNKHLPPILNFSCNEQKNLPTLLFIPTSLFIRQVRVNDFSRIFQMLYFFDN